MKVFSKILIVFFVLLLVLAVAGFFTVKKLLGPATTQEESISLRVKVPSGTSVSAVGKSLKEDGLILSSDAFYYYAKFKKIGIKSGVYTISSDMSVAEILSVLESGKQDFIAVSIPEGYTLRQMAVLLEEHGVVLSSEEFISECYNKKLLEEYKIPGQSFEGYLFPDTYFFTPNVLFVALLATLYLFIL